MPYRSHRSEVRRNFDRIYDPDYLELMSSRKDEKQAGHLAYTQAAPVYIQPNFDDMFANAPKAAHSEFRQRHKVASRISPTSSASSMEFKPGIRRLQGGGTNNPYTVRKGVALTDSFKNCKTPPGQYHYHKSRTDVNVVNVHFSESQTIKRPADVTTHSEVPKRPCKQTRGTQSLYRESSAQTLPFLPKVSNSPEQLKTLEVFRLSTFLPEDGPPGLYEVERLERARKRWAFHEALKANFRKQLETARQQAKLPNRRVVLEAFEWESWIEREEYIQECQMLRLELLIRMFDKREHEMHEASKSRIELSCDQIAAKRAAGLRKNEIEFDRQMRRLEIKRRKIPRNWRKETISNELGNPSSEFYAPQMRYGVNPSRRHFVGGRKAFEARIDNLEKRAVNMQQLTCPYAKLKEWSKPKGRLTEVEQNFCSDENLKKLYEGLKGLREQRIKQKTQPKCLIEKATYSSRKQRIQSPPPEQQIIPIDNTPIIFSTSSESYDIEQIDEDRTEEFGRLRDMSEIRSQVNNLRAIQHDLNVDFYEEELDSLLSSYEGSTIGWLMRFLSEEMSRLQEERKLHFIMMLAQKERWRREAVEAGLRQKENNMRTIYEELYQQTCGVNREVSQNYLDNVMNVDINALVDETATENITDLAKQIDRDIERWLASFAEVQNPLNFDVLRYLLRDLVFPNLCTIMEQKEKENIMSYIIDGVLLPKVFKELEPYDIAFTNVEEFMDRLIDTDLYYISSGESSGSDYPEQVSKMEAEALMRKLIRWSVPGRRWLTPTERFGVENAKDILDVVFSELEKRGSIVEGDTGIAIKRGTTHINLFDPTLDLVNQNKEPTGSLGRSRLFNYTEFEKMDEIQAESKSLRATDKIYVNEPEIDGPQERIVHYDEYSNIIDLKYTTRDYSPLKSAPSTYDIMSLARSFHTLEFETKESSSEISLLNTIFGRKTDKNEIKMFVRQLIGSVATNFILSSETDVEKDEIEHTLDEKYTEEEEAFEEALEEEQFSDHISTILNNVINNDENSSGEIMQEYDLEINETEWEELNTDKCKCSFELERQAYIRNLFEKGRVKIIPDKHVQIEVSEEDKSSSLFSGSPFEYSSDNIEQDALTETLKAGKHVRISMEETTLEKQLATLTEKEIFDKNVTEEVEQTLHQSEEEILVQSLDTAVEETADHTVEQSQEATLEQTVEQSVEQSIEPTLAQTVEQTVEQSMETTLQKPIEQTVEQNLEQSMEPTLEQTMEHSVEQSMESTLAQTVEKSGEQTVEQSMEATLEKPIEQTVEQNLEQSMEPTLEQTMEHSREQSMEPTLEQTMEQSVEQITAPTVEPIDDQETSIQPQEVINVADEVAVELPNAE